MAYFRLFLGVPKTAIFGRPRPGGEIPDFRKFFFFFFLESGKNPGFWESGKPT